MPESRPINFQHNDAAAQQPQLETTSKHEMREGTDANSEVLLISLIGGTCVCNTELLDEEGYFFGCKWTIQEAICGAFLALILMAHWNSASYERAILTLYMKAQMTLEVN